MEHRARIWIPDKPFGLSGMTSVGSPGDQTGNPPAGWGSEGEFRIADFAMSWRQQAAQNPPASPCSHGGRALTPL